MQLRARDRRSASTAPRTHRITSNVALGVALAAGGPMEDSEAHPVSEGHLFVAKTVYLPVAAGKVCGIVNWRNDSAS